MNCLDGIIDDLDVGTFASIESHMKPCNDLWQGIKNVLNNARRVIEIYEKTGVPPECNFQTWETEVAQDPLPRLSSKENVAPNANGSTGRSRSTRNRIKKEKISLLKPVNDQMPAPTRPAPKRTKQKRNQLCIKEEEVEELERVSESRDSVIIQDVAVPVVDLLDSDDGEQTSKKEETEEIPASTRQPSKRTKKKITETIRIKQEKVETETKKPCKVTPADSTITMVNLPESDIEEETVKNPRKMKIKQEKVSLDTTMVMVNLVDSTGTEDKTAKNSSNKTRQKEVKKRTRKLSSSGDDEQNTEKRPKSDSDNAQIEDVVNDATFVSNHPTNENLDTIPSVMNATVVVANPKFANNKLVTQDESEGKKKTTKMPTKTVTKVPRPNATNVEASSAKKKLIQSSLEPAKASRTKTRAQAEAVGTPEVHTPAAPKLIPKPTTAAAKKTMQTPKSSKLVTAKFASELKASQAEFREREKKRREKEKEALASMQVQLEERKRKLEEKQARVQQQREIYEKEKQKQKEELLKKKVLKMKALEEQKRQENLKKRREVKQPIYMTTRAPRLPTLDCYDSDEEEHKQVAFKEVPWARSMYLRETLFCMMTAGETMKNSFFSRQADTADLQEIFEVIEPEKLKRSSSAIWHKPPRYTMMPVLDQHLEDSEEEDDY